MEGFLGFLGLIGIVFLAIKLFQPKDDSKTSLPKPRSVQPDKRPSAPPVSSQPSHFDAESAHRLPQVAIVEGPAWIVDGDTIRIKQKQIRLFGVDAPELNHPHGKNAKWALHKLCKGHSVRAEITEEDEYGRFVAKCFLPDGRDLSAEMVKVGMAIDWAKYSGGQYKSLEPSGIRKKLFLADARQKGRMHVWEKFEARDAQK